MSSVFDSSKYEKGSRKKIKSIIESGDLANFPKQGDFLARYDGRGLMIVEIFSSFYDGDNDFFTRGKYICVDSWWNFIDSRGNLERNINDSIMMGDGYDTYFANNSEITLLLNKLKEIGKTWDFKEKKLIPLEQ